MWKLIFTNHITCAKHKPTASNKEKKYINHNLSWGFPQKKKKKNPYWGGKVERQY